MVAPFRVVLVAIFHTMKSQLLDSLIKRKPVSALDERSAWTSCGEKPMAAVFSKYGTWSDR